MAGCGYECIIWDWNGTLLDDAWWCLEVINTLLKKRGLPPIGCLNEYRAIFGFPVIDYYRRAGFDFEREPFEAVALEFVEAYDSGAGRLRLFDGAVETLAHFHSRGVRQFIISASEARSLGRQVEKLNIGRYFEEVCGIKNIFAESKINACLDCIARNKIDAGKTVLIGDTSHDAFVAAEIGADCILIPNGHQDQDQYQDADALSSQGATFVGDIKKLTGFLA